MSDPLIGSVPVSTTEIPAYRFVKTPAAAVVCAASTDVPIGSSQDTLPANSPNRSILIEGKGFIEAGGVIAKYAPIMPTTGGKALSHTGTNTIAGIALQAASGNGHVIEYAHRFLGVGAVPVIADLDITVNAEGTNTVAIDIQVVDQNGDNIAAVVEIEVDAYELTMIEGVAAEFTLAETGAGTIISTTANGRIHLQTDANGAAQVTITDVGGDRDQDVPLEFEIVNYDGPCFAKQIKFATFATS